MSEWLGALRTYILVIGVENLAWETAHLPLYTVWSSGSLREQVIAVLHCTGGDLLTAVSAITAALVTSASPRWPEETFARVAVIAIVIGLAYTGFSEWLNVHVRHTWAYAPLMPILPIAGGLGLSPLLQWLAVPSLAIWTVRRDVDRKRLTIP